MSSYRSIVGLDVGPRTVKAVRLVRSGRRWKTVQTEMLRLPPDSHGTPAAMVARWLQTHELAKAPIALNLPGQSVMFQTITLPPDDPRTTRQAAAVEVARFQEMADETTAHAVLEIAGATRQRQLLLLMARAATLETLLQAYREQDLNVVAIVPTAVALYNFAVPLIRDRKEPVILADIGPARTDLGVARNSALCFGRSFGGFRLAGETGVPDAADFDRAMTEWIDDFEAALTMYHGLFPPSENEAPSLLLSGDACDAPGFVDAVEDRTELKVIRPQDRLPTGYPRESHRFAVAAGVAATELSGAPAVVNLLPPAAREELLLKRQKRYWIAAAACGALILAILMVGGYRNARRAQQHLEHERQNMRRCEDLARAIEEQKRRGNLIFEMAAPLNALIANGPLLQDVVDAVARHRAPEDVVTLISDAATYFSPPGADEPALRNGNRSRSGNPAITGTGLWGATRPANGRPDRNEARPQPIALNRIIVEGFTPHSDLSTVGELIRRLRASPMIDERTDMLPDDQLVEANAWTNVAATRDLRRFVIDIHLHPDTPETP